MKNTTRYLKSLLKFSYVFFFWILKSNLNHWPKITIKINQILNQKVLRSNEPMLQETGKRNIVEHTAKLSNILGWKCFIKLIDNDMVVSLAKYYKWKELLFELSKSFEYFFNFFLKFLILSLTLLLLLF